ncbi:MAG: hypothetical protein AB7S26_28100 [Sandaracinaceae bacterium]
MDEDRAETSRETLSPRSRTPLARQASASVTVYAAVTGLAGAIPVPLLDSMLGELSRGAAMRRVAARHGVTLTPDARAILAGPGTVGVTSSERGRLVKMALSSVLAPFRVAARLEDAMGTLFAAVLLDHYLARPDRPMGASVTLAEAQRVRSATQIAIGEAGFDALRAVPVGLGGVLKKGFDAARAPDPEGRSIVERFVDAVLDGFADAPVDLLDTLSLQFDRALERDGGTP